MHDVQPQTVSWLWEPYIPKGKLTLLEGDPGIGKSWLSLAMATGVSLGKGLPGMAESEPSKVILLSAEDGLGDTIRPRLDAMQADTSKIHAVTDTLDLQNGGIAELQSCIEKQAPALVIVDPLMAYIGAGVDIHRANETRAIMSKLAGIAAGFNVAIVLIRHLTKGGASKPIYRGLGSIDIAASCRSALLAGCDPDNPAKRAFVHIKSNLAPMGAAVGYEVRDSSFYWTGISDLTAGRILAAEDSEYRSAGEDAEAFLREELAQGPLSASQIITDARNAGISEVTMKRAKARLSIATHRQGEPGKRGGGKFIWELPYGHLETQKDLEYQEVHIEKNDTLNQIRHENETQTKSDDTLNPLSPIEVLLGMSIKQALSIWQFEGAPIINISPSENCLDLEKMLINVNFSERHIKAIRQWIIDKQSKNNEANQ
jgi:hypothetical protein